MNTPPDFDIILGALNFDHENDQGGSALADYLSIAPQEHIAHYLTHALYSGNVKALSIILDLCSPIAIDYKKINGQHIINGHRFWERGNPFSLAKSDAEIKQLMELAPKIGLGFLTGVNSDQAILLERLGYDDPDKELTNPKHIANFQGDLPRIDRNGVIHNPELLNAMKVEKDQSAYPESYSDILCWVPKDMVDGGDLDVEAYESIQEIFASLDTKEKRGVEIEGKKVFLPENYEKLVETLDSYQNWYWFDISVFATIAKRGSSKLLRETQRVLNEPATDALPSKKDALNILSMTSKRQQYGLDFLDGHYLCPIEVHQAMQLQQSAQNPVNLERAKDFILNHSPLLKAALTYARDKNKQIHIRPETEIGFKARGHEFINMLHGQSPIKDWLLNSIPPSAILDAYDKWNHVYHDIQKTYFGSRPSQLKATFKNRIDMDDLHGGKAYESITQHLGINNRGMRLFLTVHDLNYLAEKGIKLDKDTAHLIDDFKAIYPSDRPLTLVTVPTIGEPISRSIAKVLFELGMNPVPIKKRKDEWIADKAPQNLVEAVSQAARYRAISTRLEAKPLSLVIMLEEAGIEACAGAAKTPAQWSMLQDVFGNKITEYVKHAPKETRRKFLMHDLGL